VDATEISKAVAAWVVEVCPEVNNAYKYDPARIEHALPIAIVEAHDEEDAASDPRLGLAISDVGIEQAVLHVTRLSIELVVDEKPAGEATAKLEGFVAALAAALRAERAAGEITLAGRVEAVSPFWQANYEPPFIQFEGGVKGRRASFSLAVAELS
jgi:hypothetical protein